MAQHYTPIWDDWPTVTRELNDQEKGRLIDAIVAYDNGGDWQERIKGNERYVFPGFQARIDRYKEANAGKKKETETEETEKTEISESDKKIKKNKNSEIPKVKDKVKDKDIKETVLTDSKEKAASLDRAFDTFWAVYPRHTAKQDAKRAFLKVSPDDALLETMLTAIQRQKQTDQWSDPRYIPHPATWLNGRRWEDEAAAPKQVPVKQVSAQQYTQRDYDEDELEKRLGVNDLFRGVAG
jgi:hypothetical protein